MTTATGLVEWTQEGLPVGQVTAMAVTDADERGRRDILGPLLHAACGSRISTISVADMTVLYVTCSHDPVVALSPMPGRGLLAGMTACPTGGIRVWKEHEL